MNTTRIADLPDSTGNNDVLNNTYIPINVHPNPYGNSNTPTLIPPPISNMGSTSNNSFLPQPQPTPQQQQQQQFILPSRDIPTDTTSYTHDEEVQANYIPKHNSNNDYIRDYEKINNDKIEKYEKEKKRKTHWEFIFDEIQTPVLVGILFFFFQIPFVNSFMFRNFSFLPLFNADGNTNTNGFIFKSISFSIVYYIMLATVNYIAE